MLLLCELSWSELIVLWVASSIFWLKPIFRFLFLVCEFGCKLDVVVCIGDVWESDGKVFILNPIGGGRFGISGGAWLGFSKALINQLLNGYKMHSSYTKVQVNLNN